MVRRPLTLEVRIEPHAGMRGKCLTCREASPGYDRLPERQWKFGGGMRGQPHISTPMK